MTPPKVFDAIQSNRLSMNSFVDESIQALEATVGIGEWEFIGLFTILTLVFHVIRHSSNVTLTTLDKKN